MQARIQKWGNSLAVRIPKSFASQTQLGQDSLVEMSVEEGKVILQLVKPHKESLLQLLEGVTETNLHGELETGPAMGREEW